MRKGRFTGLAFLSQDSSKESKLNISVILLTIVFFIIVIVILLTLVFFRQR